MNLESMIFQEAVIPILESITNKKESSLNYFQFPKKRCVDQSQLLVCLLEKNSRVIDRRTIVYSADDKTGKNGSICSNICQGTQGRPWVNQSGDHLGAHNFTCNRCN